MTQRRTLSRRTLLRGAGGIAIALPFLEAMSDRGVTAAAAAPPRRLVIMYTPNGTVLDARKSTGTETAFELGTMLQPLAALKAKLLVLEGIDNKVGRASNANAHNAGIASLLTATKLIQDNRFDQRFGTRGWGDGISIDQQIAGAIGGGTKFASLQLGVQNEAYNFGYADPYGRISYSGSASSLPNEQNPANLFTRLFADAKVDPAALEQLRRQRKSVLDFVGGEFAEVEKGLGASDRGKLDLHLTTIREMEKRIDLGGRVGGECLPKAPDAVGDPQQESNFPAVGKAQMDLLVTALACDLTRVATFMWATAQSGPTHRWADTVDSHHSLSHKNGDPEAVPAMIRVEQWYAKQLAYLATSLDAIPEGNGTLLDSTTILWCMELAGAPEHSFENMPLLLVGGCGGALRTGRLLRFDGVPHGNLHVSLMNAMGVPGTSFGDPAYCTGPLAGLT